MIEALNTLPLNELIRRARILGELSGVPEQELRGARVLGWQNGAGDDVAWVIPPGGGALLLVLDHESELNFYVEAEAEDQKRMYHGVPAPLLELVSGLPDESVFLSLGDGTASVPVASAVAYLPAEAEAGSQT